MKTLKTTTIILLVICSFALVVTEAGAEDKSDLEVLDIKMEPIRHGRGVVIAKVRNNSDEEKAYDIDIRAETPHAGWQTQFPHVLVGGGTQRIRHAYTIPDPISDLQRIRLRFYAAGTGTDARGRKTKHLFKEVAYSADDVEFVGPDDGEFEPATEGQRAAITEALRKLQDCVRNKDYEAAWQFFSEDFRDAQFFGRLGCLQKLEERPYWYLPLSKTEVLALEPKSAGRRKDILALTTALEDERWMVGFIKVSDKWRIDSLERIDATPREKIPLEPTAQEQALRKTFEQWQDSIRDGKDEVAWGLMASAWRRKGWLLGMQLRNDRQRFTQKMDTNEGVIRAICANLRPESVTDMKMGESAILLNAGHAGVPWVIDFVMEDGRWKISHIDRRPGGDWQERLLPKMQKRVAQHFDIFYYKGSTAEKEIDKIAEQRDRGFREICRFLGKDSDVRIRMVLFEDEATKYSHTGSLGMGLAFRNTVIEIYNAKQKLNPYHETAHILTGPYGSPPALFNEGFAVYISERLGSHALATMRGGESSIYERVRELSSKGEWIPLEELLTYNEIGSGETNPPVAYPEAASFVKFLIDTYDKDKFLKAYRTLRNSSDKATQQQNVKALETIYGKSLDELKSQWKNTLLKLE